MTRFDRPLEPFVVLILFAVIFLRSLFSIRESDGTPAM
jgi:hypothetical protein